MKRFAWLAIFAFCTALAQVQPVDLPVQKHEVCGCCEEPGACGMPDCAPLPVTSQPVFVVQTPAGQRAEVRKLSPAPRANRESFYAQFESRPALAPAWRASLGEAPAAGVPFFKAHCSFLL